MFIAIHPEGIEPPSQEPESYVISITLRVETCFIITEICSNNKFFSRRIARLSGKHPHSRWSFSRSHNQRV